MIYYVIIIDFEHEYVQQQILQPASTRILPYANWREGQFSMMTFFFRKKKSHCNLGPHLSTEPMWQYFYLTIFKNIDTKEKKEWEQDWNTVGI